MLRLRKILLYDIIYYLIFVLVLLFVWYSTCFIKYSSKYNISDKLFEGVINEYNIDGDYLSIEIKAKEKISGRYYFKSNEEKEQFISTFNLGDRVNISGILEEPSNNTNPNLFNYKRYLYNNRQYYTIAIDSIVKISNNKNLFYSIKNYVNKRTESLEKSRSYVKTFLMGNNKEIDVKVRDNYQNIGVSHLFAVSGMHVTLISSIILTILKKLKFDEAKRYLIVILFLFFYMFLTGYTASVIRASIFFILLSINKIFYFHIKVINILLLTVSMILIKNPFIIYNIGFLFSSVISLYLVLFSNLIADRKNYFTKLFMTSFISLVASIPICLYNFFSFNILSIFYNMFFVPLITVIVFPLSLIVFFIPFLDNIMFLFIIIMENIAQLCTTINTNLVFIRPNILICLIYYLIITISLYKLKKNSLTGLILLLIILVCHYNYNILIKKDYMLMIDIGQGDCILLRSDNKTILIDTGGKMSFKEDMEWNKRHNSKTIADNTLIPLFKSLGIRKIDYLFLSHGDTDHLGEAINLINNFKVETVYFNEGKYNNNELNIIDLLVRKGIRYGVVKKNNQYLIGHFKLKSLNGEWIDENDSSSVLLVNINDMSILLTGDASRKTEKKILEEYSLNSLDILKVGHHGSKTSTSRKLLENTQPKVALISSGKDNKFNHPHREIIDLLNEFHVTTYNTSYNGSILIDFNNKVTIKVFPP